MDILELSRHTKSSSSGYQQVHPQVQRVRCEIKNRLLFSLGFATDRWAHVVRQFRDRSAFRPVKILDRGQAIVHKVSGLNCTSEKTSSRRARADTRGGPSRIQAARETANQQLNSMLSLRITTSIHEMPGRSWNAVCPFL